MQPRQLPFVWQTWAGRLLTGALGGVGTAALLRLLYEQLFPRALWLNRPVSLLILLTVAILLTPFLWNRIYATAPAAARHGLPLLPLLLNSRYLLQPNVDLTTGWFLFGLSLWLAIWLTLELTTTTTPRQHLLLIWLLLFPIYLATLGRDVGAADTFEFQVTIPRLGVVHPTGYPLYLMLGRLFTWIPLGSVAWRINLASAVFATLAASFTYLFGRRLTNQPVAGVVAAVTFGLLPTLWSQAIVAEVYPLHAVIVNGALWQMGRLLDAESVSRRGLLALSAWLGLGLTNHLTTVFLLPPAGLTLLFLWPKWRQANAALWPATLRQVGQMAVAFLSPLLLYAYLPLRWRAVNDEPMGARRFLDWVVGGRFQDALQWQAWLRDTDRYNVVGRLFLNEWGSWLWLAALLGLAWLLRHRWRPAVLLIVTAIGYSFYCLNYYVPDLNVFLVPAHWVLAIGLGGATLLLQRWRATLPWLAVGLILASSWHVPTTWPAVDASARNPLVTWGRAVLGLPLAEDSLILADSEKIAPLYYLQQAEGLRPDLDIAVLFTEAEYRARLDAALQAGQTVYLARFLPGLEGIYHLRSVGPLTEVSATPQTTLPPTTPLELPFAPLQLLGVTVDPVSAYDAQQTALTLHWQASAPVANDWRVYLRWADAAGNPIAGVPATRGTHPANDYYPFRAWDVGEVVADFYLLPRPVLANATQLELQIALAPPFAPAASVTWHPLTVVAAPATTAAPALLATPQRILFGAGALTASNAPATVRPGNTLPLSIAGCGVADAGLQLQLATTPAFDEVTGAAQADGCTEQQVDLRLMSTLDVNQAPLPAGSYTVFATHSDGMSCGWAQWNRTACPLGTVEVSGVPLPTGAENYNDQIALLDIELADTTLTPGGQLPLTLTWQALQPLPADYTIFMQVLDVNDRIVAQLDTFPLQGTFPTTAWSVGETVVDTHTLQLTEELPAGDYRLIVGWYLLGTPIQRLPLLDTNGQPLDDKVTIGGLRVEE